MLYYKCNRKIDNKNEVIKDMGYEEYLACVKAKAIDNALTTRTVLPMNCFATGTFEIKELFDRTSKNAIKKVIFNDPATIILWNDGTKTVVKVSGNDTYDKERGFLMCYLKGIVGNKTLLKELDKWVGNE